MNTIEKLNPNGGFMATYSGLSIDIENPKTNQIDILDIATGLANNPHFAGQTKWMFTVAQHSMMVADLVTQDLRLIALLHDASEAYYGDMIKPLKVKIPMFRYYEQKLMKVIFDKFNLDYSRIREIKQADLEVQAIEYRTFYENTGEIEFIQTPSIAKESFLAYFHRLTSSTKSILV